MSGGVRGRLALGTAPLLHLRFEYVADALLQFVANPPFVVAEHRPIVVVEILDDLKRPASVKDIAADDVLLEPVGHRFVAGVAQFVARLAEQQVGMAHQLMKRVQLAPCPLDELQGLGHGADGLDRRIVDPFRAPVFVQFRLGHVEEYPICEAEHQSVKEFCIDYALNAKFAQSQRPILYDVDIIREVRENDADEPLYTVRVVAERVGVPTATLRSWNQRYGVGPPEHSPGQHRLYSETDIAVVRRMHGLIVEGASPRSAARTAIDSVRPSRGDTAALLVAAFDLDVFTAGLLLDRHLRHFGVLDTWDHLVRPAFAIIAASSGKEKAASTWNTRCPGRCRGLSSGFPSLHLTTSPPIILACTPREAHSLALEALRAALGERDAAR